MKNDKDEDEAVFKTFRGMLLKARGALSQGDVSELFAEQGWELKQAALSHYENGKRRPNFSKLIQFAKVYETSTDYLLGITDDHRSVAELKKELAAAQGGGPIHKIMKRLPKDKQQQVIDFAEFLLEQEKKTAVAATDEFTEWVTTTEVLMRRLGENGEDSFAALLSSERPDLAAILGVAPEKKSIQDG